MTRDPFTEPWHDAVVTERAAAIDALHHATAIYTASPIVNQLLDKLAWPDCGGQLLDPSCGDGAFLVAALERLLARQLLSDDDIATRVAGWEIHPSACTEARERVATKLTEMGRARTLARQLAERIVQCGDFLTDPPVRGSIDCIVGNPPYLRWLNVPSLLRNEYTQCLPRYATNDLLHSFLDVCTTALAPDGVIALVTSDRWCYGANAAALRRELGTKVRIHHLERLDAQSTFYRPKQRRAGTPPRIHPVAVVLREGRVSGRCLSDAPIYPGVDTQRYAGLPTLGEIAKVRIAPWLGTKGVFVVDPDVGATLDGADLVPAVDTDDIVQGQLQPPKRFAIRTHPSISPPASVLAHLEAHAYRMAKRGRRSKTWLPPETFHAFDLTRPSLLVPRIAKAPRAVRVPPGVLPINHNLSIVCADGPQLDYLEAVLRSEHSAQWVREHAAPLEGGYYSLTTTLLRRLPIADPAAAPAP
ncbi:Eco57I restriction-modification methylase domain-containing protein [Burkholderia sp. MBR-1]|uniref:Eco57I restriction-modification methylase domain-containing protein n=1 Tax=Burkholderia sp. MBR-1 TaxID=2732364 RepID=UPI0015EF1556|nr:N-6 DNA methylase [Burkholderia sp. MBR-1]QMI49921.1 N-6 DNA methylase [Burkholderia sp. MBR-1]